MQPVQRSVNALFLVFSGHASAIFDDFLFDIDEKVRKASVDSSGESLPSINILETQWDNGGHTGYLLEFYDWLQGENKLIGSKWEGFIYPPPMGDLKTQISRWSGKLLSGNVNIGSFGDKPLSAEIALESLKILMKSLAEINPQIFTKENSMDFLNTYCNLYLEFASNHKMVKHSIGNIFLSFLYFYSFLTKQEVDEYTTEHHHNIFFDFLVKLNLLPQGANFRFLIDGMYTLQGNSLSGKVIPSEKHFDDYVGTDPVDPGSYLLQIGSDQGEELNPRFQELIENADFVVIPPGSLSNWMPLINQFKDQIATKPVIWIVNSFHHASEVALRKQIQYIHSVGINPIIIAPIVDHPFEGIKDFARGDFERKYSDENKTPEVFSEVFRGMPNVIRCIPLQQFRLLDGGIKYDSMFIDAFFSTLCKGLTEIKESGEEITREVIESIAQSIAIELNRETKIDV